MDMLDVMLDSEGVYLLSEAGWQRLVPLMARAKADEADTLGAFSDSQAQQLKELLKLAIDWTA